MQFESVDEHIPIVAPSWRLGRKGSRRNPYQQIDKIGFVGRKGFKRPKPRVQRLGSKSKRSWGFKMPKIRIRIVSPLKLLARLRDWYVNLMMNFASSRSTVGMAMGPMGSNRMINCPRRNDTILCMFTEAELMYIEYMRRDPAFMRSILA
jgi:hypothetical protein